MTGLTDAAIGELLWVAGDAMARHDAGTVADGPLISVCWDADRLCLPRVGVEPQPQLLSTRSGRELHGWAGGVLAEPLVGWVVLLTPIAPAPDADSRGETVFEGGCR